MFDIGWSELVLIAVVALIAIGPKELPGVLRMVGQWMAKARRMAAEFQGQFQEAMREAEMADIKKSFDEVKEAATGIASGNVMTSLQKDVNDALQIGDIEKTSEEKPGEAKPADAQAAPVDAIPPTSASETPVIPTTPATPTPETFVEAEAHSAANEPLAIVREPQPQPEAPQDAPEAPDELKSAKAS
ncbi:Sec-independent protein translocase protein TatB [Bradyrhizobium cenepequi]